ncbi:NodB [Schleiferilactobacillus shenzhenensis LY-73]|uniref:NodB n=1 Tax=Schleiferilactobacillus shenzhenensis LY-73 TaxID=1231336 RepID=U4TLW3_9LACO|nr:NodB [Schleiferilactobacillus shenzhenensis LY-73]
MVPPAGNGQNHDAADAYAYDAAAVRAKMSQTAASGEPRVVFLTFDDGVNTTMTPRMLATLKQYGVHATFFVVGNTITPPTAPILRQEFAEGHAIGTHSFDHVYTTLYPGRQGSTAAIVKEAADGVRALQSVLGTGYYPKVWRYPGGHMSWQNLAGADAALRQMNLTWMDWNAAVGDALGAA